jgi:hypothetical protein
VTAITRETPDVNAGTSGGICLRDGTDSAARFVPTLAIVATE